MLETSWKINLTIVLQNPDFSVFENSIDLDQLASDEASWSGSTLKHLLTTVTGILQIKIGEECST